MVKINAEIITGIAFVFLSILFFYAASVNRTWSILIPADFVIFVIGLAFIALGIWSSRRAKKI
jgi:putative Ca2+/H+ antiporter (TMEM165/GDT1 family)